MNQNFSEPEIKFFQRSNIKSHSTLIHLALFIITFITTVIAGLEWTSGTMGPYEFNDLAQGLPYAISALFFLTAHEFGHYFAAKAHKVETTLPYYIPFPPIPGFFNFGTMGAVIRIKSPIPNNKAMFDIGVAGPLAGFIACIIILVVGFTNLPGPEYLEKIHPGYFSPDYKSSGLYFAFGDTILFTLLREIFSQPGVFIPPMSEIYHYPFLCIGWFGLFVTAMNMLPIGQLDGGHIVYSMFGLKRHEAVASISMISISTLGFMGLASILLNVETPIGWSGWLFWALILYFIIKVKHPPVYEFKPLSSTRMILGWISILILLLSFSPSPFTLSMV